MKKLIFPALCCTLAIINVSCNAQKTTKTPAAVTDVKTAKSTTTIEKIVIEEITRGRRNVYTYTPTAIKVEGTLKGAMNKTTTPADFSKLQSLAGSLDMEKLPTYPAPSMDFAFDGAMATTISITKNGLTYTSATFDKGKPPAQLSALYKELMAKAQ